MVSFGKKNRGVCVVKKVFTWLLCAAWMGVIYLMSAIPGDISGGQSGLIVDFVLAAVRLFFGKQAVAAVSPDVISLLVRKAAHMTEYAILFLLYRRALSLSGAKYPCVTALVMSAGYAATDEWHQGFVADRNPSLVDVCIDTLGAGIAWGGYAVFERIRKKEL